MPTGAPQQDTEFSEQLEVLSLEKMLRALCKQIALLIDETQARHEPGSREAAFQVQAFEERRRQALKLLENDRAEQRSIRIGNLERLVEALHCSRDYFRCQRPDAQTTSQPPAWTVRVR